MSNSPEAKLHDDKQRARELPELHHEPPNGH